MAQDGHAAGDSGSPVAPEDESAVAPIAPPGYHGPGIIATLVVQGATGPTPLDGSRVKLVLLANGYVGWQQA